MGAEPDVDPVSAADAADGRFELTYAGRAAYLTVHAPHGEGRAVHLDDVVAAFRSSPLDSCDMERVNHAVGDPTGLAVLAGEVAAPRDVEGWFIKVSSDGLAAYAVPAQRHDAPPHGESPSESIAQPDEGTPEGGAAIPEPEGVSEEALRAALAASGVTAGLLDDVLAGFAAPRPLDDVLTLARGRPPVAGQDAVIELAFDPEEDMHVRPVIGADGRVDFHATHVQRFVPEGATLAERRPPVEGTPGLDVQGRELPAPAIKDRPLEALAGKGTAVQDDALVAAMPGRPVHRGDKVEVLAVYMVTDDLDYSVGNIEFVGDVVVAGDVKPGFRIQASGSVVVKGITERASITAGGDIAVGGVVGHGETVLEAGGNVAAHFLHNAAVTAEGDLKVSNEAVNCTVRARSVRTPATGRLVGGDIVAVEEIDVGTIGSDRAIATHVTVTGVGHAKTPVVRARGTTHSGAFINVRWAVLQVEDDIAPSSFWNVAGTIVKLKPGEDETHLPETPPEQANAA